MHHVLHTLTSSATFTVIADYLGPVFLCICLCLRSSLSDSKQVESGAKQQAAATEGASEQAQYGSDAYGQAHQ